MIVNHSDCRKSNSVIFWNICSMNMFTLYPMSILFLECPVNSIQIGNTIIYSDIHEYLQNRLLQSYYHMALIQDKSMLLWGWLFLPNSISPLPKNVSPTSVFTPHFALIYYIVGNTCLTYIKSNHQIPPLS